MNNQKKKKETNKQKKNQSKKFWYVLCSNVAKNKKKMCRFLHPNVVSFELMRSK